MSAQQSDPNAPVKSVSWRSPEIVGEIILLAVVLGLAIYYIIELPGLREPARCSARVL